MRQNTVVNVKKSSIESRRMNLLMQSQARSMRGKLGIYASINRHTTESHDCDEMAGAVCEPKFLCSEPGERDHGDAEER